MKFLKLGSVVLLFGAVVAISCGDEAADEDSGITATCVGKFSNTQYNFCLFYTDHGEPSEGFLKKDCEQTDQGGAAAPVAGTWTEGATCDETGGFSKCEMTGNGGDMGWVVYDTELATSLQSSCDGTYTTL